MSIELSQRICKQCGLLKQRNLVGKFDNHNKKYQDENGKTWNGNLCPGCHVEQVRLKIKLTRSLK